MRTLSALGLVFAAVATLGTAVAAQDQQAQIENAFRGVMQDRSAQSEDEALYVEKCSMCHRQMGMGTVLLARRAGNMDPVLEGRETLSAQYIRLAARAGIGNMPRIGRAEVSDAELDRIARYLVNGDAE